MDQKSQAVRAVLERYPPAFAAACIRSFSLPPDEETFLIDREVHRKSVQQIAMEHSVSVETVKRRRRAALEKIAGELHI